MIYLTHHRAYGPEEVWCFPTHQYDHNTQPFIPYTDLQEWIVEKMGIQNLFYEIDLSLNGVKCTPFDEFSVKGGYTLDVIVHQVYVEAMVYDHCSGGEMVTWTRRFATEKEAVQHVFSWLVQEKRLDIAQFLDQPEVLDNDDDRRIRRRLKAVLEEDEHAEIETTDDLWEWCQVVGVRFPQDWSFVIRRKWQNLA